MKISVIATTYNRPDALTRVMAGLAAQVRLPDEVIIADDGSAPDTADAVEHFRDRCPFALHHVWQEDEGFRAAAIRNRAIRKASGEYLVFLDGDCVPEPHFVMDHCRLARPGTFFQGKRVLLGPRWEARFTVDAVATAGRRLLLGLSPQVGNRHHVVRLPAFPATVGTALGGIRSCNMGIYKADLVAVNGFNEAFVGWGREDSELVVRLYRYGLKRRGHPFMAICFHLWHPENDRRHLARNDDLLRRQQAAAEGHTCRDGLSRLPENG